MTYADGKLTVEKIIDPNGYLEGALINKTRAAVQRRTAALCSYFRLASLFKSITASTMTPMTSTMLTIPMTMMAESSSTK